MHAKAGDRARYQPVHSVLTPGSDGDPLALVQAYRDVVGARECYVADLDAIQGGELQRDLLQKLVGIAAPCALMVDAGSHTREEANELLALGAGCVVIGLETLSGFDHLALGRAPGTHRLQPRSLARSARPLTGIGPHGRGPAGA